MHINGTELHGGVTAAWVADNSDLDTDAEMIKYPACSLHPKYIPALVARWHEFPDPVIVLTYSADIISCLCPDEVLLVNNGKAAYLSQFANINEWLGGITCGELLLWDEAILIKELKL